MVERQSQEKKDADADADAEEVRSECRRGCGWLQQVLSYQFVHWPRPPGELVLHEPPI